MKWFIHTIPHKQQRYDTCGDYIKRRENVLEFRVSVLEEPRMEALIAIHEIVEQTLCEAKGISINTIDAFDLTFTGDGEPGDHIDAPYRDQHRIATFIEKYLARKLGIDWKEYERKLNELSK